MTAPSPRAHSHSFVPALGFDWLTPLYDPLIRTLLREQAIKQRVVDGARLEAGMSVLDLGCGTGTLTLLLKRACPGARVVGVDVDPKVLGIARAKLAEAGVEVELLQGAIDELDLPEASFDRVVTSLVLHHLTTEEKRRALGAVRRLLKPGGELHVADFGPPQNPLMWVVSRGIRLLDGSDRTEINLNGGLPDLIRAAGFSPVAESWRTMTPFGTLVVLEARAAD